MNELAKKLSLSVLLVVAIFSSWLEPLDSTAIMQVDDGMKRALASYAVARTLNAVISVAQGTEVSVQVGVGATFAPGQILDPVNDLVEQFGDWMLAASVAFGIMHILIKIGSFWLFSLLLTISASAWLSMRWRKKIAPAWLIRVVIILMFARFSIPVATVGNEYLFKQFLAAEYTQNQIAIQANSDEVSRLGNDNSQDTSKDIGSWDLLKQRAVEVMKIKERIDKFKQSASQIVEHVVRLIVVFILQTVIIPIGLLFMMYKLGVGMTRSIGRRNTP